MSKRRLWFPLALLPLATLLIPDGAGAATGVYVQDRTTFDWNGRDRKGERVASGVYFVRLSSDEEMVTSKVVVVR